MTPYGPTLRFVNTKTLLHAYVKYQELLQAAIVFALTGQNVGKVLPSYYGACIWLKYDKVNSYLVEALSAKHSQTGSGAYPVAGGCYHTSANYKKWKGEYGANRRKFLADCIESIRQELVHRKYKL